MNGRYLIFSTVRELTTGYIALGQIERARRYLADAVKLAFDCGAKGSLATILQHYGKIAQLAGNNARAVRLWGAADRILTEFDESKKFSPPWRMLERDERLIENDEKLVAARAAGRTMTAEQAVAYALEE